MALGQALAGRGCCGWSPVSGGQEYREMMSDSQGRAQGHICLPRYGDFCGPTMGEGSTGKTIAFLLSHQLLSRLSASPGPAPLQAQLLSRPSSSPGPAPLQAQLLSRLSSSPGSAPPCSLGQNPGRAAGAFWSLPSHKMSSDHFKSQN